MQLIFLSLFYFICFKCQYQLQWLGYDIPWLLNDLNSLFCNDIRMKRKCSSWLADCLLVLFLVHVRAGEMVDRSVK